jgi:hypothetical protein
MRLGLQRTGNIAVVFGDEISPPWHADVLRLAAVESVERIIASSSSCGIAAYLRPFAASKEALGNDVDALVRALGGENVATSSSSGLRKSSSQCASG